MNKDSHRHAKVDGVEITRPQLYTRNYRQLKNTETRRNNLPQIRAHQKALQYQMANPENIHTSNITQTEIDLSRNLNLYIHICI